MTHKMKKIHIVEVGPRDGLQSIPSIISTEKKIEYINRLTSAGLPEIEVTSFVSSKWVPQLADSIDVSNSITKDPAVIYTALIPNKIGLDRAIEANYSSVAVLTSTSETFSQNNTNCSISDGFSVIKSIKQSCIRHSLRVRGYISTVWHCPYEGAMKAKSVLPVIDKLLGLGISEISLGDTIGKATPDDVKQTLETNLHQFDPSYFALHFHDTFGHAEENIRIGLGMGITIYDSSAGGIGGCPYAPGSSGNISTEKVLSICESLGIKTGVNKNRLIDAGNYIIGVIDQEILEHA